MTVRGKTDCTQSGRHSGILQALLEEPSVLFELDLFHPSSRKRVRTTDNLLQPNSTCVVEALEESPRPAKRSLRPLTQNLRVSWAVVPSTLYITNHEDFLDLFSPTTFWAWHPRRAPWRLDYILQSLHTRPDVVCFQEHKLRRGKTNCIQMELWARAHWVCAPAEEGIHPLRNQTVEAGRGGVTIGIDRDLLPFMVAEGVALSQRVVWICLDHNMGEDWIRWSPPMNLWLMPWIWENDTDVSLLLGAPSAQSIAVERVRRRCFPNWNLN